MLLFHLSSDVRHHHHFSFKGYSIGAFSLTEPVEKDTDKLLKQRDRHRDLIVEKDTTWSSVLQEYGEGKKREITTELTGLGGTCGDHSVQPPLPRQETKELIQEGFGCLQAGRHHNLFRQPVTVLCHPQCKAALPQAEMKCLVV